MELSVFERLLILNLDTIPKVGNIVTMKIKQQLLTDVGFTEDEIKEFGIQEHEGKVAWLQDSKAVDIPIGAEAVKLLVTAIESSENLNEAYVPLYERLKVTE